MKKLSQHEIRQIAVEARRDPRTVVAVVNGTATDLSAMAVREAAARLGIGLPKARRVA